MQDLDNQLSKFLWASGVMLAMFVAISLLFLLLPALLVND
jgi:hypothetical protein